MFKNIRSFVIKFKGSIEIIPKFKNNMKMQTTKNKPKYNKRQL